MKAEIVDGNLLDQDVEVIVNAWNRNIIPWWLLIPHGVSGSIRKRAGIRPFVELGRAGPIPLGGAVITGAGRLPYKAIIHVAGLNLLWLPSAQSVRRCVRSALDLVNRREFRSVAFPVIGSGVGGIEVAEALGTMQDALAGLASPARVVIVRYAG